jgi:predicted dehydrogenase
MWGMMNRRTLSLSMAGAAVAGRVMGANDRVRVGLIGAGNRGSQVWQAMLKHADFEAAAVCDVYEPFRRRGAGMGPKPAKEYSDFRKLIEDKEVDAVVVATPDHWHAIQCIMACAAGKDVYCEKPLSLHVAEGRAMVEAARKNGRVVQTGSMQRSGAHYIEAVARIHAGDIGEVHKIAAAYTRNAVGGFKPVEITGAKPAGLDWDMWLGPAPWREFDAFRCIYNFRWFWDYSGGQMTNWGAHHLDIARWIAKAKAPEVAAGFGGRYTIQDGGETPDVQEVLYKFPGVIVSWTSREINFGRTNQLEIFGSKGTMTLHRGGYEIRPEVGADKKPMMEPFEVKAPEQTVAHTRNFLDCVKSRQRPNADIEEGHLTAAMCHLGNLSMRVGRSIQWDAAREQAVGDAAVNAMLMKPYRKPWKLIGS